MLYLRKKIGNAELGIWKMEETCEELYPHLSDEDDLFMVHQLKTVHRKLEILSTRVLLKELVGEEKHICYYDSGKPYLEDNSYRISISHTKGYVAVIVDKERTMGLDIEQRTDKIFRVRYRVIPEGDYIDPKNEQVHLLLHWSAKEAMFKYLNTEGVDFRSNLHVESFTPQKEGIFNVSESKTVQKQKFEAHYMVTSDFVLVCLAEL